MTAQVELVYICSSEMTTWFTLLDYDDSNKLHQNALLLVKRDLDAIPEDAVIDDRIKQPWPAAFLNRFGLES